jgi:hypothetical protein
VLLAIGRSPEMAHTALRLTLGAPTTEAEIDRVLEVLPRAVVRIRGGLPPSPPRPPSPRTTEGCDLRPKRDSSLTTTG